MIDKPKYIMTRAEAIAAFSPHCPFNTSPHKVIDFYVKAGMLEIKEEVKSLTFNEILRNFGVSDITECRRVIEANGYKIQKTLEAKQEVKPTAFAETINLKLQEKGINISVHTINAILDIMEKMKNNC